METKSPLPNFSALLIWKTSRSGGAGGQHVNKVSSKVQVSISLEAVIPLFPPDEHAYLKERLMPYSDQDGFIQVMDQSTRSQVENKKLALQKLKNIIRKAREKPKKRKPTRPPGSAVAARLNEKKWIKTKKTNRGYLRHFPNDED